MLLNVAVDKGALNALAQNGGVIRADGGQADAVSDLVRDWRGLQVLTDLAGIPRVLVCEKP